MDKPFLLYDTKFKKNYMAYGSYKGLISLLKLRLGLRNVADKFLLSVQYLLKINSSLDKRSAGIFSDIVACFEHKIEAAILYNTSWYKETMYIGYIQTSEKLFFIKVYRNQQEALFQKHQSDFIEKFFAKDFNLVPVTQHYNNILVYNYVSLTKQSDEAKIIFEKIIRLNQEFVKTAKIDKMVSDILPSDIYFVFDQWNRDLSLKIKSWVLAHKTRVPVIPCHGDMTPWNIAVKKNGEVFLFDYEQAGWHTPFYDYFHYLVQPAALKNEKLIYKNLNIHIGHENTDIFLILYLIDQLYQAADKLRNGYQDKHFLTMVRNKAILLSELLDKS